MNEFSKPITVLLIDDHTLFRSGIRSLLQGYSDFTVVGDASDGIEGLKRVKQLRPDVVLLALNLPGMSGLETLQLLLQNSPDIAVILLAVSEEEKDLKAALQMGVRGYLKKNTDADSLVRAIRRAATGELLAEAMTTKLMAHLQGGGVSKPVTLPKLDRLTPREKEILTCLARGESNKAIARTLNVAESTVKIHVQNILKKLNLSSRVQAAVIAVGHGMASASDKQH